MDSRAILQVSTSSGSRISLDGVWESGCAFDQGRYLSETFSFSANSLVIDIRMFEGKNCQEISGTDQVSIEFTVEESFEVFFEERRRMANKVTGTQTVRSKGKSARFKQTFFIDDQGGELKFYHGRFQDDGGTETSDGFPTQIIPVAMTRSSA